MRAEASGPGGTSPEPGREPRRDEEPCCTQEGAGAPAVACAWLFLRPDSLLKGRLAGGSVAAGISIVFTTDALLTTTTARLSFCACTTVASGFGLGCFVVVPPVSARIVLIRRASCTRRADGGRDGRGAT